MSLLDSLESLDFHDRTTQLAAGGAGVVAVALYFGVIRRGKTGAAQTAEIVDGGNLLPEPAGDGGTTYGDQGDGGYSGGVSGGGGSIPTPVDGGASGTPPPASKPNPLAAIFTKGKVFYERARPDMQAKCGPGYVALMGPDGKVRCRLADDRLRGKGQKTTYLIPDGAGDGKAGQVIDKEGAKDSDLGGTVGGYPPFPSDTTAYSNVDVREGDSLASISHRVYGTRLYWPKLLIDNPGAADLTVGDRLNVS